jgi:hypothetical protein
MVKEATELDSKERKESTGQQRIFFLYFRSKRERGCTGEKERERGRESMSPLERERERGGGREKKMRVFVDLIGCFPSHLN